MELKEALLNRRSIRKFTAEPVGEELVEELMHAAMSGPSACNRTPWEFYAVSNPEKLALLREASHFTRIEAPLAVVVCGELGRALPKSLAEFWVQDCSAATENILLRAVDLGLGSVWCGVYPQPKSVEKVREALELDDNLVPLNIVFIGRPAETHKPRDQYNGQFVHYIR